MGSSSYEATAERVRAVARAIALGLNDPDSGRPLRIAIRDSQPNAETSLQAFLQSETGRALRRAVVQNSGFGTDELAEHIGALPLLDFYFYKGVSRAKSRLAPGIVVVASLNSDDGPFWAFNSTGNRIAVKVDTLEQRPVLAIFPTETRRNETFRVPHAEDGLVAVPMRTHEGTDWTYLESIQIFFNDSGDRELLIKALFYSASDELVAQHSWFDPNFGDQEHTDPPAPSENPHAPLIDHILPDTSFHYIRVEVWEDDCNCWGNDDDFYGARKFFWGARGNGRSIYDSNGIQQAVATLAWIPIAKPVVTSIHLSPDPLYLDPGQSGYMYASVLDQYGYGLDNTVSWSIDRPWVASLSNFDPRRVTVSKNSGGGATVHASVAGVSGTATVNTYVPPPELEVSIMGSSIIPTNQMCGWMSSVYAGEPPYTYEWTRDFHNVSGEWAYTGSASGEGNFRLKLTVHDSRGYYASDILHVSVDDSVSFCSWILEGG